MFKLVIVWTSLSPIVSNFTLLWRSQNSERIAHGS